MTAFANFKSALRERGNQVNTLADERRDGESRYVELMVGKPGEASRSAIVIVYQDGSYRLFIEQLGIEIAGDVAALVAD